jgi:hypothetical protein
MRESEIEQYFVATVLAMGGQSWKFRSLNCRGVSDRIVCLPNGETWFVELKTKGGRLSPLQKTFASQMAKLHQNYKCLWNFDQINQWRLQNETL